MKFVRMHGTGVLRNPDEAVRGSGEGQKRIRIKSVGVCGSHLHWFSEGWIGHANLERPLMLGHEFAGETEDVSAWRLIRPSPAVVVNFVKAVNPIHVRPRPSQSASYEMAYCANRWNG
jgi:threonine dehydrogenase-like Zn-dependent dehydrogenase